MNEAYYRRARRLARAAVLGWYRTPVARRLYGGRAALLLPRRGFHPARAYRRSSRLTAELRFRDVKTFTFFVGYWRSGHTALAAALNGHPNVLISHELDLFRWLDLGVKSDHLFRLILERDRWFGERSRLWESYDYTVSGGTYTPEPANVVGDKMAAITTQRLLDQPLLLERVRSEVGVPIRAINVVRNPFDNIATAFRKSEMTLDETIRRFRRLSEGVEFIANELQPDELLTTRHEDLAERDELERIWAYLGLATGDSYFADALAFIRPPEKRARERVAWTDAQIESVLSIIGDFSHLTRYDYESP